MGGKANSAGPCLLEGETYPTAKESGKDTTSGTKVEQSAPNEQRFIRHAVCLRAGGVLLSDFQESRSGNAQYLGHSSPLANFLKRDLSISGTLRKWKQQEVQLGQCTEGPCRLWNFDILFGRHREVRKPK